MDNNQIARLIEREINERDFTVLHRSSEADGEHGMSKKTTIIANDAIGEGYLHVKDGGRRVMVDFERDGKKWGFAVLPQDAKALAIALLGGTP